jgi:DNA-binding NarL/FixJ family response regulator
MYLKIDERNLEPMYQSSIRILVADADATKIEQVRAFVSQHLPIDVRGQTSILVCKQYFELAPLLAAERPDLLLLGILDRFNSLDTCQECHQQLPQLPIVLLSRQNAIDDYFQHFRRLALGKGATEVVNNELLQLDRLILGLAQQHSQSIEPLEQPLSEFSVAMMLAAIQEISAIGSNYFGPLAQGNYWRKAHARIIAEYPTLQNWSADHFGKISCDEAIACFHCTEADVRGLQQWVIAYISEGERIIVDFGEILKNSELLPQTHDLLADRVISE